MTAVGKAHVSHFKNIFEKRCSLNKQLQGANAKAKIFVTFLSLCRKTIFVG